MRSNARVTPELHRVLRSYLSKTIVVASTVLTAFSVNLMADHPIADPATGLCPADTVGQTINCVSNDVTIALVTAEDEGTKCVHGETAVLNLNTKIEINAASARHDVAAWIPTTAELGKNMLLTSSNGGPASCQSKGFHFPISADDSATVLVEDLDGDACGDVNGINNTFTRPFTDATVSCDGTVGGAEVDAVVSWHLSGNDPVCSVHQDYGGFKKSKCSNTTSFVDLVVVGKLEVCKVTSPTDIDFEFTIEAGTVWVNGTGADPEPETAASPFYLNPVSGQDCMTFDVLTAQDQDLNLVTITETNIPEGWGVSDISCVNNADGGAPAAFTDNGNGFTIGLTEGNLGEEGGVPGQPDVTCTVTDTEGGSITIIKDSDPDDGQNFDFTGTGPEFDEAFTLDDDNDGTHLNTAVFDSLDAGEYTFTELGGVAGWDLSGIQCEADSESGVQLSLANQNAVINLSQGGEVICTFSNTQRGGIRVVKETLPDGDLAEFTFTGDLAGMIADDGALENLDVEPGNYTSTEDPIPTGWDLVSVECDDDNSTGSVETATASFAVEPGEIVTCVFTNVKQGTIVVNKTAEGGDGEFPYGLYIGNTEGDPIQSDSIETVGGSGTISFINVPASDEVTEDTYVVWEDLPDGWEWGGVVCEGADQSEENALAIDLDPGETVTCDFTNIKHARLTVAKQAFLADGVEFCFDFVAPGDDPDFFCLETEDGDAERVFDDLTTEDQGTWYIAEQEDELGVWVLASESCSNSDHPSEVEIGPGDDVTCTFVNIIPTPVPVNNTLALLMLILTLLATGWYFRPARMR